MAESLSELKDKLQTANEKEEAARLKAKEDARVKAAADKAAADARADAEKAAKKDKLELQKEARLLLTGPEPKRIGADLAGLVINETTYRLIQWALSAIGAQSPWWFTLVPLGTSIPTYLFAYPRKEEGAVRMFLRTWGLAGIITSSHDIVGQMLGNRQQNKAQVAAAMQQAQQQAAQIAALQQQLAAQQPAQGQAAQQQPQGQ